jgi:hypothetical protein
MAKENNKKLISEDRTDTVIYDSSGRESLRLGFIRREYENGDGVESSETIAENMECGNGTVISPGHLMRPPNQGGVTLQRCSECHRQAQRRLFGHNRPVNQFSPNSNMKPCFHCKSILCEKHTFSFNNHLVCPRCKRRQFIIHSILKPIFFRRVKET